MTAFAFNDGWEFAREPAGDFEPVTLPHDAMVHEPRSAAAPAWAHGAYFPGGRYRYRKSWAPEAELAGKQITLRFEGVYRHSRVLLDGREIGGAVGGYTEFGVRLDPSVTVGRTHVIEVLVDNTETPNARWYTGSGIYRPVRLDVVDAVHIEPDGIRFRTLGFSGSAQTVVSTRFTNPDHERLEVRVALRFDGVEVASATTTTTGTEWDGTLAVAAPQLWSAEHPALYDLEVAVEAPTGGADRRTERVGIRTIRMDAKDGLQVNGEPVLLRGANIHHDSGVLGAATFAAAERRRITILKATGFNAIRSAHNPAARALLDACDELGMYVMDELFDGWYDHKTDHDDANGFDALWRGELAALVAKDRNRPSVIMYSIGNENGEAFSPRGRAAARDMVAELHRADPDRSATIGVNMVGATFAGLAGSTHKDEIEDAAKAAPDMTSTALNVISNRFGLLMKVVPRLRAADRGSRDILELVDVAGYNYGTARYAADAKLHPRRVMLGTESMPGDIARNWALVERVPALIGDFMWAGWDYLGEAGGGSWAYGTRSAPYLKPYPQLTSGTGALDITGEPGAPAFLARAAWGLLDAPAITVRPLDVAEGPIARTSWRSTDAIPSWSWRGREGRAAELEIYSADDEVELIVDGRSVGRRPAGPKHGFVARFRAPYRRGVVEAIGYCGGRRAGSAVLRSAGDLRLRVIAETDRILSNGQDLAYLRIELADDSGVVDSATVEEVSVTVDGPAVLAGLGSGAPSTEESFTDDSHRTYRGRALAVLRSSGTTPGPVTVVVTSQRHGSVTVQLEAVSTSDTPAVARR